MAAGNFTFYNSGKLDIFDGTTDLDTDSVAVILLGSGYTPDVAAHASYSDVSANEIADADYTQQSLPTPAFSESAGTVTFDSGDISFGSNVSIEAKYAVFVKGTATSLVSGDPLIGYVDLDTSGTSATVSSTNSTFSVNTPNNIFTAS